MWRRNSFATHMKDKKGEALIQRFSLLFFFGILKPPRCFLELYSWFATFLAVLWKGVAGMVPSITLLISRSARYCLPSSISILLLFSFVISANAQSGGGTDLIGTGGRHTIQGRIYFPSGRRTDVRIKVRLENTNAGDLSVLTDSNGWFSFRGLNSGSYTVVIDGGNEYETARETVYIDTDGSNPRRGIVLPLVARVYTVNIDLRPKRLVGPKPGVVNAALAGIPEEARELYLAALRSAQANDHKKAVEQLTQAIAFHPNFPLALGELGVQYLKLNLPEKAVESFASALKLTPDDMTLELNYGAALLEANRLADAETHLRKSLDKNGSSWVGHMYLGITLMRMRKFDDAEKELQRALALGGDDLALPHYYLGGIYWGKGQYRRAADELEKYVKLSPNGPDAERTRAAIKELRRKQS